MNIREEATRLHDEGYNCAQSVFASCRDYTGIDDKLALSISAAFGGGARCGEICGALSGTLMAVGKVFPFNDCTDQEAKDKIAAIARGASKAFKDKFGNIRCNDLKANEVSCSEIIEFCAELAENVIKENK